MWVRVGACERSRECAACAVARAEQVVERPCVATGTRLGTPLPLPICPACVAAAHLPEARPRVPAAGTGVVLHRPDVAR